MSNPRTWIVYKAEGDDPAWRDRCLLPSHGMTDILNEEWSSRLNEKVPKIGERFREYANLEDPGNGITHGKDSDWIVTRTQEYLANDESCDRVIICYCTYQPIAPNWQKINRVKPTITQPV